MIHNGFLRKTYTLINNIMSILKHYSLMTHKLNVLIHFGQIRYYNIRFYITNTILRNTTYDIQFSISYDDYSLVEKSPCLPLNCFTKETN